MTFDPIQAPPGWTAPPVQPSFAPLSDPVPSYSAPPVEPPQPSQPSWSAPSVQPSYSVVPAPPPWPPRDPAYAAPAPAAAWAVGDPAAQSTGVRSLLAPVTVGFVLALLILVNTAGAFTSLNDLDFGIVWALCLLAALIAATFLAPTTATARVIAVALFAVAALLFVVASDQYYYSNPAGIEYALVDVIGLAGWLILRRRKPVAFVVLIPAAVLALTWNLDSEAGRWLRDLPSRLGLGSQFDDSYGRSFSFHGLIWETWANVDWIALALLALVAGIMGTLSPRTAQLAQSAQWSMQPPPGGGYPAGYPAPGYAPTGYAPTGYAPTGYAPSGYAPTGYAPSGYAASGPPPAATYGASGNRQ